MFRKHVQIGEIQLHLKNLLGQVKISLLQQNDTNQSIFSYNFQRLCIKFHKIICDFLSVLSLKQEYKQKLSSSIHQLTQKFNQAYKNNQATALSEIQQSQLISCSNIKLVKNSLRFDQQTQIDQIDQFMMRRNREIHQGLFGDNNQYQQKREKALIHQFLQVADTHNQNLQNHLKNAAHQRNKISNSFTNKGNKIKSNFFQKKNTFDIQFIQKQIAQQNIRSQSSQDSISQQKNIEVSIQTTFSNENVNWQKMKIYCMKKQFLQSQNIQNNLCEFQVQTNDFTEKVIQQKLIKKSKSNTPGKVMNNKVGKKQKILKKQLGKQSERSNKQQKYQQITIIHQQKLAIVNKIIDECIIYQANVQQQNLYLNAKQQTSVQRKKKKPFLSQLKLSQQKLKRLKAEQNSQPFKSSETRSKRVSKTFCENSQKKQLSSFLDIHAQNLIRRTSKKSTFKSICSNKSLLKSNNDLSEWKIQGTISRDSHIDQIIQDQKQSISILNQQLSKISQINNKSNQFHIRNKRTSQFKTIYMNSINKQQQILTSVNTSNQKSSQRKKSSKKIIFKDLDGYEKKLQAQQKSQINHVGSSQQPKTSISIKMIQKNSVKILSQQAKQPIPLASIKNSKRVSVLTKYDLQEDQKQNKTSKNKIVSIKTSIVKDNQKTIYKSIEAPFAKRNRKSHNSQQLISYYNANQGVQKDKDRIYAKLFHKQNNQASEFEQNKKLSSLAHNITGKNHSRYSQKQQKQQYTFLSKNPSLQKGPSLQKSAFLQKNQSPIIKNISPLSKTFNFSKQQDATKELKKLFLTKSYRDKFRLYLSMIQMTHQKYCGKDCQHIKHFIQKMLSDVDHTHNVAHQLLSLLNNNMHQSII